MADQGHNEGFRVLDDFVCEAIHAPSVPLANPAKQGQNEGMSVIAEVVFDVPKESKPGDLENDRPRKATATNDVATPNGNGKSQAWARMARLALKVACIAAAAGLGSLVAGWVGASLASILSSIFFLGESEST